MRFVRLAALAAAVLGGFLAISGPASATPLAGALPAGEAVGSPLVQKTQYYYVGPRRRYRPYGYYRPYRRVYRPYYYRPIVRGPRVVCRIRYTAWGPRRVCWRRW